MTTTVKPDLKAIKARLGSLSPGVVSRITEQSKAVATLLLDCKHLLAYVEEVVGPRLAAGERFVADEPHEAGHL